MERVHKSLQKGMRHSTGSALRSKAPQSHRVGSANARKTQAKFKPMAWVWHAKGLGPRHPNRNRKRRFF